MFEFCARGMGVEILGVFSPVKREDHIQFEACRKARLGHDPIRPFRQGRNNSEAHAFPENRMTSLGIKHALVPRASLLDLAHRDGDHREKAVDGPP